MNYTKKQWWERFQKYYTEFPELGLAIDLSRMNVEDAFFAAMEPKIQKAFADMDALEKGALANPDEKRMVGHYWLRNPALAPTLEMGGLKFGQHAVAVTMVGSDLDKYAISNKWIDRFPMWDWVGGRTSELSAVGLLPAALQGIDVDDLIAGGKIADAATRKNETTKNPAALLSLAWFASGNGKGTKNMVVLPYKDRLELFSNYLQQLVMESLGKRTRFEWELNGNLVNQGICVLGNKG